MNLKANYTLQWFLASWAVVVILITAVLIPLFQMPVEDIDNLKRIIIPYIGFSFPFFLLFIIIVFGAKWTV